MGALLKIAMPLRIGSIPGSQYVRRLSVRCQGRGCLMVMYQMLASAIGSLSGTGLSGDDVLVFSGS